MSAYIVSRGHIRFLVCAARTLRPETCADSGMGSYYHGGEHYDVSHTTEDETGLMLWQECARSVAARYPGEPESDLPGPGDDGPRFGYTHVTDHSRRPLDPLAVLKAIACYEYQACETDDWKTTRAAAFCSALRKHAIYCLPGYDKAPWGCPESYEIERPGPRLVRAAG